MLLLQHRFGRRRHFLGRRLGDVARRLRHDGCVDALSSQEHRSFVRLSESPSRTGPSRWPKGQRFFYDLAVIDTPGALPRLVAASTTARQNALRSPASPSRHPLRSSAPSPDRLALACPAWRHSPRGGDYDCRCASDKVWPCRSLGSAHRAAQQSRSVSHPPKLKIPWFINTQATGTGVSVGPPTFCRVNVSRTRG